MPNEEMDTNESKQLDNQQDVQAPTPAIRQRTIQRTVTSSEQQVRSLQSTQTTMSRLLTTATGDGSSRQSELSSATTMLTAQRSAQAAISSGQKTTFQTVSQQQALSSTSGTFSQQVTGFMTEQALGSPESIAGAIAGQGGLAEVFGGGRSVVSSASQIVGLQQQSFGSMQSSSQRSSVRVLTSSSTIRQSITGSRQATDDGLSPESSGSFEIQSSGGSRQTVTRSVITSSTSASRTSSSIITTSRLAASATGVTDVQPQVSSFEPAASTSTVQTLSGQITSSRSSSTVSRQTSTLTSGEKVTSYLGGTTTGERSATGFQVSGSYSAIQTSGSQATGRQETQLTAITGNSALSPEAQGAILTTFGAGASTLSTTSGQATRYSQEASSYTERPAISLETKPQVGDSVDSQALESAASKGSIERVSTVSAGVSAAQKTELSDQATGTTSKLQESQKDQDRGSDTRALSQVSEGEKKSKSGLTKKFPTRLLRKLSKNKNKSIKQTNEPVGELLADRATSQASALNLSFEADLTNSSLDQSVASNQEVVSQDAGIDKPAKLAPETTASSPNIVIASDDVTASSLLPSKQVPEQREVSELSLKRTVRSVDNYVPVADQAVVIDKDSKPTELFETINLEPEISSRGEKDQEIGDPIQMSDQQTEPKPTQPPPGRPSDEGAHQNATFETDEYIDRAQAQRPLKSQPDFRGNQDSGPGSGSGSDSYEDLSSVPILKVPNVTANYNTAGTQGKGTNLLDSNVRLQPGASSMADPEANQQHPKDQPAGNLVRPYPKKVFFVLFIEFCERFSYYGLRALLVLYLRYVLQFEESTSVITFHLFSALCFLTPLLGAVLADSILGKFKTILYLAIIYLVGELFLLLSSIFWDTYGVAVSFTIIALILTGIGAGGIKPCVVILGAEQFLSHEIRWQKSFFTILYGTLNMGALLAMFLTPILKGQFECVRREDCYPFAFSLPFALMLLGIVVFVSGRKRYYQVPLSGDNVIVAFAGSVVTALGRKLRGVKTEPVAELHFKSLGEATNSNLSLAASDHSNTSDNLSSDNQLIYREDGYGNKSGPFPPTKLLPIGQGMKRSGALGQQEITAPPSNDHWLYLAADKYGAKHIDDFRQVLGAFFVMLPLPLYWSLFNQQSSLWTLQASQMDGHISSSSSFEIQPDSMSVLNALFLLVAIPLFEFIIYPIARRCNLLVTCPSRIAAGGFLAALAFVLSAIIEWRIQQYAPPLAPPPGQANLMLVNGLNGCSMQSPNISYIQIPINETSMLNNTMGMSPETIKLDDLEALHLEKLSLAAGPQLVAGYKLSFKLGDTHKPQVVESVVSIVPNSMGCPLDQSSSQELILNPLDVGDVKLVYLAQGNGKLSYKIFNDSMTLPHGGKARVRLLYEFFGSSLQATKPSFYLDHHHGLQTTYFSDFLLMGQVVLSKPIEIDIPAKGGHFVLKSQNSSISKEHNVTLYPGTSNLILVHQSNASDIAVACQVVQDNNYRISMLWQIGPYIVISMSEVLFSITVLEFAYTLAPMTMRSLLSASMSVTVAVGDLITVALEALNMFPNQAHNYLFYATILSIAMLIFLYIVKRALPRQDAQVRGANN